MENIDDLKFYGRRIGRALGKERQKLFVEELDSFRFNGLDDRETWMEIGFGAGEHLAYQAEQNSSVHMIGCEAFRNGVVGLLTQIKDKDLRNISIYADDVRKLLPTLPSGVLQKCFVLFPDPWPKKRHHKRRIINPEFLDELARLIKADGVFRFASDVENYFDSVVEMLGQSSKWNLIETDYEQPPSDWIQTRYEARGRRLGHKVQYLTAVRA